MFDWTFELKGGAQVPPASEVWGRYRWAVI